MYLIRVDFKGEWPSCLGVFFLSNLLLIPKKRLKNLSVRQKLYANKLAEKEKDMTGGD